jgi:hypothetical protein
MTSDTSTTTAEDAIAKIAAGLEMAGVGGKVKTEALSDVVGIAVDPDCGAVGILLRVKLDPEKSGGLTEKTTEMSLRRFVYRKLGLEAQDAELAYLGIEISTSGIDLELKYMAKPYGADFEEVYTKYATYFGACPECGMEYEDTSCPSPERSCMGHDARYFATEIHPVCMYGVETANAVSILYFENADGKTMCRALVNERTKKIGRLYLDSRPCSCGCSVSGLFRSNVELFAKKNGYKLDATGAGIGLEFPVVEPIEDNFESIGFVKRGLRATLPYIDGDNVPVLDGDKIKIVEVQKDGKARHADYRSGSYLFHLSTETRSISDASLEEAAKSELSWKLCICRETATAMAEALRSVPMPYAAVAASVLIDVAKGRNHRALVGFRTVFGGTRKFNIAHREFREYLSASSYCDKVFSKEAATETESLIRTRWVRLVSRIVSEAQKERFHETIHDDF